MLSPFRHFRALASVSLLSLVTMGMLMPAHPAAAALITRPVNQTLNATALDEFKLDVDLNGTTDFIFSAAFASDPFDPLFKFGFDQVTAPLGSTNGVAVDAPPLPGFFPTASRLAAGAVISAAGTFSNGSFDLANLFFVDGVNPPTGNFGGQTGFLGLRFESAGGPLFGFAQVTVNGLDAAVNPLGLTIGAVGFNNVSGQSFAIPSLVPEPGTLPLFALASLGLLVLSGSLRRGRNCDSGTHTTC